MKALKVLRDKGKISKDVVLMFDEMFLQKCEEYITGKLIGADEENNLFKGVVSFMVVGLKETVSYVVKAVPELNIDGGFLQRHILDCLKILKDSDFNVRAIVSDNHSSNVNAYSMLLEKSGLPSDSDYMIHDSQKIYLIHDAVHLVKNVRNNLLNYKRFLFPAFKFDGFQDEINVPGGSMHWKTLHDVHERDKLLQAHFQKARMITPKVLHPGSCKQNVNVALAVFDESTSAGIEHYFPERKDSAEFLRLINKWWVMSNSKNRWSSNPLGNAAVKGDNKPKFLRALADWVQTWTNQKIRNAQNFTLTAQTSTALVRTLRGHAQLIEDLLDDGFDWVLTARFQSDPLERRFSQYRQMSGGRFLVSLKDVQISEKIIKIKSLIKEGCDIDDSVKDEKPDQSLTQSLLDQTSDISIDTMQLEPESRKVAVHIAGYIAKKLIKQKKYSCCTKSFVGVLSTDNPDHDFIQILNRGGLTVPSSDLTDYVCTAFAILESTEKLITSSGLPARTAACTILENVFRVNSGSTPLFTCAQHQVMSQTYANRAVSNIFFNNKRKILTTSVVKDTVVGFKKPKRSKSTGKVGK